MEDCISQASELTQYTGWASWAGLIAVLFWMVYSQKPRRVLFPLVAIILLHPMLWGRFSDPCTTELNHSISLFLGLGIAVVLWSLIRPTLDNTGEIDV